MLLESEQRVCGLSTCQCQPRMSPRVRRGSGRETRALLKMKNRLTEYAFLETKDSHVSFLIYIFHHTISRKVRVNVMLRINLYKMQNSGWIMDH
jgi:hypothetical protein